MFVCFVDLFVGGWMSSPRLRLGVLAIPPNELQLWMHLQMMRCQSVGVAPAARRGR